MASANVMPSGVAQTALHAVAHALAVAKELALAHLPTNAPVKQDSRATTAPSNCPASTTAPATASANWYKWNGLLCPNAIVTMDLVVRIAARRSADAMSPAENALVTGNASTASACAFPPLKALCVI